MSHVGARSVSVLVAIVAPELRAAISAHNVSFTACEAEAGTQGEGVFGWAVGHYSAHPFPARSPGRASSRLAILRASRMPLHNAVSK